MGDISQGVQSLNLMSLFKSPLGPFFGDLELCYGKNWNSFWKYLSGEVCTYLSLDHPCTGGLFQGPYILLSLKYFLWFIAVSRAFLWHQKPKTGERKLMKRLWNRRNIWGRVKCTGLEIAPQCMGGPKRGMYTLPHSYIFRNSFNFYHSTTLTHRKRAPKVTGKVTSNSGFVRSAISSHM